MKEETIPGILLSPLGVKEETVGLPGALPVGSALLSPLLGEGGEHPRYTPLKGKPGALPVGSALLSPLLGEGGGGHTRRPPLTSPG